MKEEFARSINGLNAINLVQAKLHKCSELDQLTRNTGQIPYTNGYSKTEHRIFSSTYHKLWRRVDLKNAAELKEILKEIGWPRISIYGEKADQDAWLIVQHADHDPQFQKEILAILETLHLTGESNPANFAYLYDRVAVSSPEQNRLQRFGTQGQYVGVNWQPYPVEEPAQLDKRRAKVGLDSMENYCKSFPARFEYSC